MTDWWQTEPWRMVQTNLREIDFKDMDPERFAGDVERLGATVVMVSTSGIVGNYPTRLPYHFRNPYASDTILRDVIAACHKRGIRVIGRMDFSKVREPMSSQHPEWAFVGEKGERVCYNGDTHVCCNSEYQRVLSLNILKETLEMLPIDGVFFNFGGYTSGYDYSGNLYGECVCENCRSRFRDMFGEELPPHPSDSPLYEEFKRRTLDQAHREVRETVQAVQPGICIANDYFSGKGFYRSEAGSGFDRGDWHYSASDLSSRARVGYPGMRASITTVDFGDIAYRYASPGADRQLHRLSESVAHGGSPDLYIMGRLDNRENQAGKDAANRMFRFHAAHIKDLDHHRPEAELLLVRPESHWLLGGRPVEEYMGWFEVLSQAHYLFNAVDESRLSHTDLSGYRAVILPAAHIGEDSGGALKAFLRKGGCVLATACGAEAPEWLGVESVKEWTADSRGAYVWNGDGSETPHMAAEGARVAPIVGGYAHCVYGPGTVCHQAVIQPHHYGPPERCYYTEISSEPAYATCRIGGGQAVWIPWLPGFSYMRGKLSVNMRWIQDLLEAASGLKPIETNAPACVEIVLTKSASGCRLLSFVNGSGDTGGSWNAPLPIGPVKVTLPVSETAAVEGLEGEPVEWQWQDGILRLSLPINKVLTVLRLRGAVE